MNFSKIQLRLIAAGRALLQLWEDQIKHPYPWAHAMTIFVSESNSQQINLVGVEIGVYRGRNAASILSILPIKKLFLIDPYRVYEGFKGNNPGENFTQVDFDGFFKIAQDRLKKFEDKIEFVREKSEEAVAIIPDELDFVFIDGNHKYEYVKHDIELYYPKVKQGGVFGGDNFEASYPDVARAVTEFAIKFGIRIQGRRSPISHDWWVVKK